MVAAHSIFSRVGEQTVAGNRDKQPTCPAPQASGITLADVAPITVPPEDLIKADRNYTEGNELGG